ncbi:hypothetical protein JCM3766R1_004490 [Sporobolomyces carnicolor]
MAHARSLSVYLGLAPDVRPLQVFVSLSSAAVSISLLVFISASTPFVLSSLLDVPAGRTGDITGSLILADELTALALYLPVGGLCDRYGVKYVASGGYVITAVALVLYVQCASVWELILVRILFAAGAASLVATISAILSSLSRVPDLRLNLNDSEISERSPLLSEGNETPNKSGRLAGMLGFSSGVGALVSVFGYLRLPNFLSRFLTSPSPDPLARALALTYYLVAGLAVLEGAFVFCALPSRSQHPSSGPGATPTRGYRVALRRLASSLGKGFTVAKGNRDVSLALFTSFATRAQAVVVTAMIPLLVNRYYLGHDLCHPAPTLAIPDMPNKHSCKQAYVLASILTGIVQLVTLLVSPLVGFVASSPLLSRKSRNPQAVVLAVAFLLGTVASTGFGFLPGGDPRQHVVVVFVLGLGIAQAAGTVVSLALVTKGRGTVVAHEGKEVGGRLGILLIGSTGGILFDRVNSSAPFLLLAVVNLVVAVSAVRVYFSSPAPLDDHDSSR